MHLVSWNVASWPTALNLICQQHGSLDAFLARHGIDILALQEVKMQSAVIETALVPRPPSSSGAPRQLHAKSYESFWAPCRATEKAGSKSTSRGFNGVATFARAGWTMRAERDPLGDAALDAEGRCVLTFHGAGAKAFAVFNVYVPNASQGSARLPFKVKFLRALRRRMQQVRSEGVAVLLVGDLNISRRRQDSHPDNCRIDVRKAIADAAAGGDGADDGEYMAAASRLLAELPAAGGKKARSSRVVVYLATDSVAVLRESKAYADTFDVIHLPKSSISRHDPKDGDQLLWDKRVWQRFFWGQTAWTMHLNDDEGRMADLPDEIIDQLARAEHVSYQFDPGARARDLCATSEMSRPKVVQFEGL